MVAELLIKTYKYLLTDRRAADNMVLAKKGLTEVIEQ